VSELPIPDGWDSGVVALRGHVLQSSLWARVQRRLGYEVTFDAGRGWCWLGVVRSVGPFRYLYLPFGPVLSEPGMLEEAVSTARDRARALGCAFVRVEPDAVSATQLNALGARAVRSRQHQHTLLLRIDVDEATLRRGLNSGHRSRINTAEKRGLSIVQAHDPADIADFIALLRQTESRAGFYSHDDPYYHAIAGELMPGGEASLYYAEVDGERVAGALLFDFGDTRYYAFAASDTRRRAVMPAPPLVWRTILDGRAKGMCWFDFWGVAPPDQPDHKWAGITDFKRGFGGALHSRAGTWELVVRPVHARLFSLAQAVRR
jgi:lipid II:glycine glycyltransferase (peptidoglycan interpeptide bridge formation enzyme)